MSRLTPARGWARGPLARRRWLGTLGLLAFATLFGLPAGCGLPEHTAESVVVQVEAEYAAMRADAERVDPVQARAVDGELEFARQAIERGDYETATRAASVFHSRLRELRVRIELDERARRGARADSTAGGGTGGTATPGSPDDHEPPTVAEPARRSSR